MFDSNDGFASRFVWVQGDKTSKRIMGNRSRHLRDPAEEQMASQMPLRKYNELENFY